MIHHEILETPSLKAEQGVFTFYGEATINAPAEKVWNALTDFQSYHKWNKYNTHLGTPSGTNTIAVGDTITLSYRPETTGKEMDVPCKIISLSEEEMSLSWRGMAFGLPTWMLFPEKVQKVTKTGENQCRYQIYETQAGFLAYVVKWQMGAQLGRMNQGIANGLKEYVEAGAG